MYVEIQIYYQRWVRNSSPGYQIQNHPEDTHQKLYFHLKLLVSTRAPIPHQLPMMDGWARSMDEWEFGRAPSQHAFEMWAFFQEWMCPRFIE